MKILSIANSQSSTNLTSATSKKAEKISTKTPISNLQKAKKQAATASSANSEKANKKDISTTESNSTEYFPKTSTSWKGKPICEDIDDMNKNCCCSKYDIEAVLEEAYESGNEEHPWVKAIEDYPCISCMDLEIIADELAAQTKDNSRLSLPIPGAPKTLNPSNIWPIQDEVHDYCLNLVKHVLGYSYGKLKTISEKEALGGRYKEVLTYCADLVTKRFAPLDIITGKFKEEIFPWGYR